MNYHYDIRCLDFYIIIVIIIIIMMSGRFHHHYHQHVLIIIIMMSGLTLHHPRSLSLSLGLLPHAQQVESGIWRYVLIIIIIIIIITIIITTWSSWPGIEFPAENRKNFKTYL